MITTTATPGADDARPGTITFSVHKAWWLMPYLRALALFHALTRTEPNWARIKCLINKGVTVKAMPPR